MGQRDFPFDRAWLLKVENLSMVRRCRSLIRDEFGVTLHLDALDLLSQIQRYVARSSSSELRAVAAPITRELVRASLSSDDMPSLANIPVVAPQRPVRAGWARPQA